MTVPAGGINFGAFFAFSSFTPFTYNPANGDLILEVIVSNQDNVPNGSGNGYNWADYTGAQVTRAYCLDSNGNCVGANLCALDT